MVEFMGISLIFTLGVVSLPLMQATIFSGGGYGKIIQGKLTDEGVPGILNGLTGAINKLACNELGSNFLPLVLRNHRCAHGSLAPNTFESFEKFCECINSNPCLTSAVISIGIDIDGLGNLVEHVGKCCKNEVILHDFDVAGQLGDGLTNQYFPRNSDLLNDAVYKLTDEGSDLICSFLGPNFLKTILAKNRCQSGVLMPNAFESNESFCYYFNYVWTSCTQKCVTDAAIDTLVHIPGVINYKQTIGSCCAHWRGRKPDIPPPRCEPAPPVIIPKC